MVANVVEPVLGILGDTYRRRMVILGGGLAYALALAAIAGSPGWIVFLAATIVLYPASGAFVSLGQATLMDLTPERREQNMARWNFAGAVGVVAGPLALSGFILLGLRWRPLFTALAGVALAAVILTARQPAPSLEPDGEEVAFWTGARNALRALRRLDVLRWLLLLEAGDLLLDLLLGYLALYFVDVVGVTPARAAVAVAVWTGASLLGSLAIIPFLERFSGLRYLRGSAILALLLFPSFLLVPGFGAKIVLIGLLAFSNAGWYPVLQGRLYEAMPGQSGSVMAVTSVVNMAAAPLPLAIGLAAQHVGLGAALWLLALAPVALLLGVPWRS